MVRKIAFILWLVIAVLFYCGAMLQIPGEYVGKAFFASLMFAAALLKCIYLYAYWHDIK